MQQPSRSECNRRILVVDDNRAIHNDMRKILCGNLARNPELTSDEAVLFGDADENLLAFEIDSAYQGQEALAMVEQALAAGRPYAMAFVDVRMPPGWDGVETVERIWQVYPSLQIVICTAYSDYSWSELRRRLGLSDSLVILKKPFDNIEVVQLACALTKKWQVSLDAGARLDDLNRMVSLRTRELQKAEAALRCVFESSPIGIALSDMDAKYVSVNPAFERLMGFAAEEMLGKDPVELGWTDREALNDMTRQLSSFGCVDAMEIKYAPSEQGERTGLIWLREATIDYSPHILSFVLDITDRKQMEEDLRKARVGAEAAARAKSQFLANMSHEIRTPLNGVLGLSCVLEENALSGDSLGLLRLIRASGETLSKILDDVLDYSKIECGKLELEQLPFSLRESLEWCVDLFRMRAEEKHLRLSLDIEREVPDRLVGDATRIRQVMANLVSNAIKFTEEGLVRISCTSAATDVLTGKHRIAVRVTDTGIGIRPDQMERLFRSFSQVNASMGRRFGGTGLGLAISKRLVEMMGGSIRVTSRFGEGSEFEFDFLANEQVGTEAGSTAVRDLELEGARILVAEDNYINQVVTERMLEKLGCVADLASDGEEAIRKAGRTRYDLLLMDVQMPGVDGLEAARRIRSAASIGERIPIVALTASATVEDRDACLAAGMDDYLSKPLALESLREVLSRWLHKPTAVVQ